MVRGAFRGSAVRLMVLTLYPSLQLAPNFMREQCRNYFNAFRRENNLNLALENVGITADATTDNVTAVEEYGGIHNVIVQKSISKGLLLDERPCLPTVLHSFNVSTGGLLIISCPDFC